MKYYGWCNALTDNQIPYNILMEKDLASTRPAGYDVVILPNATSLSSSQIGTISSFVSAGGTIIATGETSLCDETGAMRSDFGLSDVLGVRYVGNVPAPNTIVSQPGSVVHSILGESFVNSTQHLKVRPTSQSLQVLAQVRVPAPAGAADLGLTFENPSYSVGDAAGQENWYQEETASSPVVSRSAPLAGRQSLLFISNDSAPADQRIWRGLGDHTFTDVTTIQFLLQVSEGRLGVLLQDATGRAYYRCTVDAEAETWTIGSGFDAITPFAIKGGVGAFKSNKLYSVNIAIDFANLKQRTTVANLTDSQTVLDTGLLELNDSTTTANAATDKRYTGIRFLGGHHSTTHSEGRIDELRLNDGVGNETPSVTVNRYGSGRAIYIGFQPDVKSAISSVGAGAHPGTTFTDPRVPEYTSLLANLVKSECTNLPIKAENIPAGVVVQGYTHANDDHTGTFVTLLNCIGARLTQAHTEIPADYSTTYPSVLDRVPTGEVMRLTVKADDVNAAYLVSPDFDDAVQLDYTIRPGGYVEVRIPDLARFEILYLNQGKRDIIKERHKTLVKSFPKIKSITTAESAPLQPRDAK